MEKLGISEQLIEQLPDAVFVVDSSGKILFVNGQGETLFGWTREELIGRPIETLVPPTARAAHPMHRAQYFGAPQVRPMGAGLDLFGCRKDGSQFPAEISLSSIETEEGRLVTAVVRDATDRLKTQAKFSGLLEAAPDAMLGVDDSGLIQLVNTQAEVMFGWSRNELLGRPIETLVPDQARTAHRKHRTGYFAEPVVRSMGAGIDLSARRKDGSEFPVEISLSSIETEDGLLVTAAVRDVTERKAFEGVVARARDTAERAARSRQEFLANMSHEIRTPMNAIIGMTSLLLDTPMDRQQRDFVETMRTSGEHLLTIINDILDYAKIDAGKLVLEEVAFEIRDWLGETVDLVTLQAHEKGLELACDVAPEVPAIVIGDPARTRQVLVNLLANAVKFTHAGEVVVRVEVERVDHRPDGTPETWLRFEVADTGIGVAADRIDSLFEPFTQGDSTTTRIYGGTGLGLAISRRLVESMGGVMEMTSSPGAGTTVTFRFPVIGRDAVESVAPAGLAGQRVLIVDDNATHRQILEAWAQQHEMDTVTAGGGEEALDLVDLDQGRNRRFDLALLDLDMPGMDGHELGRALRQRSPGIRLVLLHSTAPARVVEPGLFDLVLAKPARAEKLTELLLELIRTGRVRDTVTSSPSSVFDLPVPARKLSILVVEDTPVNQKVAQHLLARFGFRADVAASGREALDALAQRAYDLVLMDIQMPEMDGLEATRRIRARWPDRGLHIVAMTANVATEDVRRCYEAGMDAFLPKPIDVASLGRMLSGLLSTPAGEDPVVDPEVVSRLREEIGPEVVRELAEEFLADLDVSLPDLEAVCQAQDRAALAAAAHKLKSPARSLGAEALGQMLHDLEQRAAEEDWATLTRLVGRVVGQRQSLDDQLRAAVALRD
ncbi:PAS domain S-box protein [Sporichthya polymorpha]|uniref:PAS domain S-box protein n=1 Tax=Sporichthya polymorpha TaxID=35751 RepID=UPI000379CDF0|nr:PAS domain S-box protein [Sporichthya polymorpha]